MVHCAFGRCVCVCERARAGKSTRLCVAYAFVMCVRNTNMLIRARKHSSAQINVLVRRVINLTSSRNWFHRVCQLIRICVLNDVCVPATSSSLLFSQYQVPTILGHCDFSCSFCVTCSVCYFCLAFCDL